MSKLVSKLKQLLASDRAAEVSELAIVLALLVAGCIAAIILLGPKVAKMYSDLNDAF